ncbi:MAG TPA: hypothetical protein ENK48_00745 [Gammaproteobacteria bacterium]|nr:hypothetical protein [Gammaproteobacteria bacterium]
MPGAPPLRPALRQRLLWRQQALMLQSLWWLAGRLPPHRASRLGRRVLQTLGPRSRKHRHVVANLRMLCPDRDAGEIAALAREVWGNLGATLAEFAHFEAITGQRGAPAAVEVVCEHRDPDFLAARRPCVFVSAHLGNWELCGHAIRSLGYRPDLIYNPQANPALDALVMARRAALGDSYVSRHNVLRKLIRGLGEGRSVALLVDVRIDEGELVPFGDAPAPTTALPAWLARKAGCPIVPLHVERVADARFRAVFHPPIVLEPMDDPRFVSRVSEDINRVIASLIRAMPGQWLCTKRRWPKAVMRARGAYD